MPNSKRACAKKVIDILKKLPPDCSDNEETDSDADEINAMIAKVMECDESDSDSSDEETPATSGTSASTAHNLNDTGAVSRTLTPTPTAHTSDDAGSPGRDHTPCQHSDPNILAAKDGSKWKYTSFTHFSRGRLQQQNILTVKPGPTYFATSRIIDQSPASAFQILFHEAILRNIQKCTQMLRGNVRWEIKIGRCL